MHSFLLLSTSETALEEKANQICQTHAISAFDKVLVKRDKSIGIEDIRNLQKDLLFTPLKSPTKAAIVYKADTLTPDAQNAFLKTLEEPPPNTILILLGENREQFLPTVLSRCTIMQITPHLEKNADKVGDEVFMLNNIVTLSLGEKLQYAETISKTKDTAVEWIEKTQMHLRTELLKNPSAYLVSVIRQLQQTHRILKKTNASTRIVIEHFFLSL